MEYPHTIFYIKDLKFEDADGKILMIYPSNQEQTSAIQKGLERMLKASDPEWHIYIGYVHIGAPIMIEHPDPVKVMGFKRNEIRHQWGGGWALFIPDKYLGPEPLTIGLSTEEIDYYCWNKINKLNNYIHYDEKLVKEAAKIAVNSVYGLSSSLNTDVQSYALMEPEDNIETIKQKVTEGLEKFKNDYAGGNHMDEQKLNEFSHPYKRALSFNIMNNIATNIENSLESMDRTNKKCGTNFDVGSLLIRSIFINEKKRVVTIIWMDNEVTMGRCGPNDIWDPEKGIAIAFMKRFWASTTQFNKYIKEVIPASEDAKDICVKEETK